MSKSGVVIKGANLLTKKFRTLDKAGGVLTERTIKRGTGMVLRESQKLVPIDKGNLRGSGFVRTVGGSYSTVGVVGYTAEYAIYVHENTEAYHGTLFNQVYADEIAEGSESNRGPNQQSKFLTAGATNTLADLKAYFKKSIKKLMRRVAES